MGPVSDSYAFRSDSEELLSTAAQARDLLAGATALLLGVPSITSVQTARSVVLEARAQVGNIIETLERLNALELEAQRDHGQAAKSISHGEVR